MLTNIAPAPAAPEDVLAALKAAAEPTRLRMLALLGEGELNVSDFTEILGQSQPRISRHLKLLAEAGIIERHREGAWAFFRLADHGAAAAIAAAATASLDRDSPQIRRDRERLAEVRRARDEAAAAYFRRHAESWDTIRALHVDEAQVEAAILDVLGKTRLKNLLDLGTGTGRILELLAPLADRALGLDLSPDMLAVARANLARAGRPDLQLRQGDVFAPPVAANSYDLVVIHQVLHYLDDGARAIREAARALAPGGRLLVVDFAPHDLEFLREAHAHRRLGFAPEVVTQWMQAAGLEVERRRDLAPPPGTEQGLTVSIWLGRDRRVVVDPPLPSLQARSTAVA